VLDGLAVDPLADITQINSELALFDPALEEKPQIIAFNKIDQPEAQKRLEEIQPVIEKKGFRVFPISALARTNLKPLLLQALELVQKMPEMEPVDTLPVYRVEEDPNDFTIVPFEDGYRVEGSGIVRAAEMTYWEYDESVRRFQRLIERLGIDEALRKSGIREGDTVYIGDFELEWQN
jgi:GTP-binding protein